MMNQLLAEGPPPLTSDAADAALDAIDLIAATIRGIDSINVTPSIRTLWRQHLAVSYPYLIPPVRAWFANAPLLTSIARSPQDTRTTSRATAMKHA